MPETLVMSPVEYSVGAHSPDNTIAIPRLRDQILSTLASGRNVAYILEGDEMPEKIAAKMHSLFEEGQSKGILPSHAYIAGLYTRNNGHMPETEDAFVDFYLHCFSENSGVLNRFRQDELLMLDDVATNYPHKLSMYVARCKEGLEDGIVDIGFATSLVTQGQFDEALPLFQAGVTSMLDALPSFEEDVHDKVRDSADKNTTVFVRVGAAHTFAAHMLEKEGYPVTITYDWKTPDTAYSFDPVSQLYRRDYLNQGREIPHLMWQRALIGESIEDAIQAQNSQYPPDDIRFLDEQMQIDLTLAIMERIKTQQEVDAFIQHVKQTNFYEVVGELFQTVLLEDLEYTEED